MSNSYADYTDEYMDDDTKNVWDYRHVPDDAVDDAVEFMVGMVDKRLYKSKGPNHGRCYHKACMAALRYAREGKPARVASGLFEGRPHAWAEVYHDGKWRVYDNTISWINNGSERAAYGDSYKLDEDGYTRILVKPREKK